MGKHLDAMALDNAHSWLASGHTPISIHGKVVSARAKTGQAAPDLTTVRRALRGATRKRATAETRSRKTPLTARNFATLDRNRVEMIEEADGQTEIHWKNVIKKARVPNVDRTTASTRTKCSRLGLARMTF